MNENELREWLERLAESFHTTDSPDWKAEDVGTNCTDAYITGCCDGEIHLAREILRKFLK
jgi:hypothetical protein